MTAPTITQLPDPPSRGNAPEVFIARADAFLGALPEFGAEANALAVYFDDQVAAVEDIVSSAGYSGTSTSAIVIGTGSKSFFTQANLSFVPGVYVSLADSDAPTVNSMIGTVTAYNRTSGAMTVNVSVVKGAGEKSSWSLSLSGPPGSDATVTAPAITSALGYTPVNKAGDTMTGRFIIASPSGQQLRLKAALDGQGYGAFVHIDTANFYLLFTGLNDANGAWTNLRPFTLDMATGELSLEVRPRFAGAVPWDNGNDGSGSGLDADMLRGMAPEADAYGNSIVRRDAGGGSSFGSLYIVPDGTLTFGGLGGTFSTYDSGTLAWSKGLRLVGALSADVVTERSDRNLKDDIADLEPVAGRLRPVRYLLKATGEERIGFIAQDVERIATLAVSRPEGEPMEVRLTGIVAILSAQVNALEDRLERLEGGA